MKIIINRTGKKITFDKQKNKSYYIADDLLNEYGYTKISVLDFENYNTIKWIGIEFNRLYTKNNIVYRFNCWLGSYPWTDAEIEEIGKIEEV